MCGYCGECRDLDLCRDERVVEDGRWDCATCGNPYDAQWIEGTLVAHVNERVRAAQLQDLRCKRCRKVKVSHLASRCVCGGLYDCVEDKRGVADDLRVMHNIASRHGFAALKDVVEWIAESSPNLEGVAALREEER